MGGLRITRLLLWAYLFASAALISASDLSVQPNFRNNRWIGRSQTITLRLSRPLHQSDGKLAIFIGATDMTDLFVNLRDSLCYTPSIILLPPGESEMIVHLVSPDNIWEEVARFPMKVLTHTGFEKAQILPRISVSNSGQVAEGHTPANNTPHVRPIRIFQDNRISPPSTFAASSPFAASGILSAPANRTRPCVSEKWGTKPIRSISQATWCSCKPVAQSSPSAISITAGSGTLSTFSAVAVSW
ncbi:MAG TPA: hypothetical protein VGA99_12865 [bacterium]